MSQKKYEGILFPTEIRVVGSYTDRLLICYKNCMLYWLTFEFEFEQHLLSLIRNYKQVKIDVPRIQTRPLTDPDGKVL